MTAAQREQLVQEAIRLGASDAGVIATAEIRVEENLAGLCNGSPPCEQYGLAPSCPPHVSGPSGFRRWQQTSGSAIVIRLDVPTAAMFSGERREIMQLLHEIVAGVEQKAVAMGYAASKSFAGGSCKLIFCHDHPDCPVLANREPCRYPQSARPSMSGFGINVAKLMQSAGWPADVADRSHASDQQSMTWIAGLVLLLSVLPGAATASGSAGRACTPLS